MGGIDRSDIDLKNPKLSIEEQCLFFGKSRGWFYYKPYKEPLSLQRDNREKRRIKNLWEQHIFLGYRQMASLLENQGLNTSEKRVYRLMKELGIKGVTPKRNLSKPSKKHKKYPYLLRGLKIQYKNQVWASDITYIKLPGGTAYVVAIIDLYSRKILSWNVSNSMETSFVLEALVRAMMKYGVPEIFNTDQGSQYTSTEFTSCLENEMVKISMDGKGRALDNIYIERFWKTLKYEDIYLYRYDTLKALRKGLQKYFKFYNSVRPHQSLGGLPPNSIYKEGYNLKAA